MAGNPKQLRELLASQPLVSAPGAHDAITAQLIQRAGFSAVYMTGAGVSTATYGRPDVGWLTLTEVIAAARPIIQSVDIPVIADADTGFGGLLNVKRTVQEFETVGAAAIHLEDQVDPKKCGYMRGAGLIDTREMCQKIDVAVNSRQSPDFLIIARTEVLLASSFDESLSRASEYSKAGADMIFINGMTTLEQVERAIEAVPVMQLYNVSGSDKSPVLSEKEIAALGYRMCIYSIHALRLAAKSIADMLAALRQTGDMKPWLAEMITFENWMDISGVAQIYEFEERFAPQTQNSLTGNR